MAYVVQSDLKGLIPDEYLREAMDDDSSGVADTGVWDSIAAAVAREIDGRLKDKVAEMQAHAASTLSAAAQVLALYFAYKRRGVGNDANPWTADAKSWQDRLEAIGKGDEPVREQSNAQPKSDVISEPSRTYPSNGDLMV